MVAIISGKNQITIPVDALRKAGLRAGDDVVVTAVGVGHVEIIRIDEVIEQTAGIVGADTYPKGYLRRLRDEWDR